MLLLVFKIVFEEKYQTQTLADNVLKCLKIIIKNSTFLILNSGSNKTKAKIKFL